jgi:hypothetical protein
MFKDTHAFCKTCENYQKLGSISKHHMMPLNLILVIEMFDSGMHILVSELIPYTT